MRKAFKMENLDCANCAEKMQHDISALPGVDDVNIAFMSQKMRLTLSDDADIDSVLDAAQHIVSGYEKDCKIVR